MRMRRKKNLEERLAAVSDYLFISNFEDRNILILLVGLARKKLFIWKLVAVKVSLLVNLPKTIRISI